MTKQNFSEMTVANPIPEELAQQLKAMDSFRPLFTASGSELERKIEALHQRIKQELPDFKLPSLYVVTDINAFNKAYGQQMNYANATVLPAGANPHEGIFITQGLIDAVTIDEMIVTLAHEYGHKYYGHAHTFWQASEKMSPVALAALKRSAECQADYFAAHFVADADRLIHSLLPKIAKASGLQEQEMRHPLNDHPLTAERMRGHGFAQVIGISPGAAMVTFDGQCNALTVPPPAPLPPFVQFSSPQPFAR